jgi:hypothetical protein
MATKKKRHWNFIFHVVVVVIVQCQKFHQNFNLKNIFGA